MHRWRKILQAGGAQCSTNILYTWCAKHTQHAKHAPSRGVWGHAPQEILKKYKPGDGIWWHFSHLTRLENYSSLHATFDAAIPAFS